MWPQHSTRKHTDNTCLASKIDLRRDAVVGLKVVNVLDCFGGENKLWSAIPHNRYFGIEKQKGKGKNLQADNTRVLESLDLSQFNVIDLDTWGVPDLQIAQMFRRTTLQPGTRIVVTCITGPMNGLGMTLMTYYNLKEIWARSRSILNTCVNEMFLGYLYDLGVRRMVGFSQDDGMSKLYGWFEVPDPVLMPKTKCLTQKEIDAILSVAT